MFGLLLLASLKGPVLQAVSRIRLPGKLEVICKAPGSEDDYYVQNSNLPEVTFTRVSVLSGVARKLRVASQTRGWPEVRLDASGYVREYSGPRPQNTDVTEYYDLETGKRH